jgi:hypothetical protein
VGQAESIGFKPQGFQYGIGRYAFTILDDSHLQSAATLILRNLRVIGVAAGDEAQAYSVSKLRRHEIANTTVCSKPITVGYLPLVDLGGCPRMAIFHNLCVRLKL